MKIIQQNKKAYFHFEILEKNEAGIILKGTEITSLRTGKVNLTEAFIRVTDKMEIEIHNMYIPAHSHQNNPYMNHEPLRKRKLLLHRKEILKIQNNIQKKGLTCIPLKIYLKKRYAKIEIGIARGKKLYDKREVLKKREQEKKIQQKKFT